MFGRGSEARGPAAQVVSVCAAVREFIAGVKAELCFEVSKYRAAPPPLVLIGHAASVTPY